MADRLTQTHFGWEVLGRFNSVLSIFGIVLHIKLGRSSKIAKDQDTDTQIC